MPGLTPMMQQYMLVKEQYKDCILFYRLGDFYEMFFEDAITASRELELVLTGRDCGLEERAPMCGVPHHAMDGYVQKLIAKGYKVAVCEQLTDPKDSKGLVERDVVRIITPGTLIETKLLDAERSNYIVSLHLQGEALGICAAEVSTGDFYMMELSGGADELPGKLTDEMARIAPNEIIADAATALFAQGIERLGAIGVPDVSPISDEAFEQKAARGLLIKHFGAAGLDSSGGSDLSAAIGAAGGMLGYLNRTQKNALGHINRLQVHRSERYMLLDAFTRRNLELCETMRGGSRRGSLLWLLDKTGTAMGSRRIRAWISQPLQDIERIGRRLDAVEALFSDYLTRETLHDAVGRIYDIERLASKIAYGTVNARDCLSLAQSLCQLPAVCERLEIVAAPLLKRLHADIDPMGDILALLQAAIADEPPEGVKDGGIIRAGYNEELDRLRLAQSDGQSWIAELEQREREATGIKSLRIKYNRVFGYYIEVTNSYISQVPYRYRRKQTLANAERYDTPELKEMEETILGAQEKSIRLEYDLFCAIRAVLIDNVRRVQRTADAIASLDALLSLARVAVENQYVKPQMRADGAIDIVDGRHPVVEKALSGHLFVPNDAHLDGDENRLLIITGPNMAGKSTYMRQVALITLMAHIGSFVPARSAQICLVDRIFTRVGASDDLSSGRSTFMVEMTEVASILQNATPRSLLILDEIGRGTSTYDGLSIAWAVVEYLLQQPELRCKTLFATHYHELSELEGWYKGVKNYCILVRERDETIVFLRRIARGGANKSFGIQVARLAGVPEAVLERARAILRRLEAADINRSATTSILEDSPEQLESEQIDLLSGYAPASGAQAEVLRQLEATDVSALTPLEALNLLYSMQTRLRGST